MEEKDNRFTDLLSSQVINSVPDLQANSAGLQTMPGIQSNRVVYPEIFYKLQPHIMMLCDQMDIYGAMMPTQEMVEQITDSIYDDVCKMYPDIAEYTNSMQKKAKVEGDAKDYDPQIYGINFRRRGVLRDLIDILLLSEFFRRRRRMY